MIDDVARLAEHSRAREESLSRLCHRLIGGDGIGPELARALGVIARNCAMRAQSWAERTPDATYVAVGRPGAPAHDEDDSVLADLAATEVSDAADALGALSRTLADLATTYDAHAAVVDRRLDPPTAAVLQASYETVVADSRMLAGLVR